MVAFDPCRTRVKRRAIQPSRHAIGGPFSARQARLAEMLGEWASDSFLLLTRGSCTGRRAGVVGSELLDVGTSLRGIRALWDCWLGGWLAARELLGVTCGGWQRRAGKWAAGLRRVGLSFWA